MKKHLTAFFMVILGIWATGALDAKAVSTYYTGDPWKMLVIVYPQIDVDYVDIGGIPKHLTATMPANDQAAMIQAFLNLPHRGVVYDYSGQTAELEAHIVISERPLTSISEVGGAYSYWPGPEDTMPEIDQYAPAGTYDSVVIFWQASDPVTGQSIPSGGWGWGGWVGPYSMTYATVFNLSWVWPSGACQGEVFLHEWLHGVTQFYDWLGFVFPYEDLHGAEEAGYPQDANGCWETWLRDYMRGFVYENGQRTALIPETWQSGSITTHDIQGWRGEYFSNSVLSDLPIVVRDDAEIDFSWTGNAPHPLLPADQFSARWTRTELFEEFTYAFTIEHDDGARLYIDEQLVFENWCNDCWLTEVHYQPMTAGPHDLRLEVWENSGWASAGLSWEIQDSESPGGRVVLPADNTTIEPGPVPFTAEAWDNQGGSGVQQVEFHVYYQGEWHLVGTDTSAPYGITWTAPDGLPDQTMFFTLHVYDRSGNRTMDPGGYHAVQYAVCKTCGPAATAWPLLRGDLHKTGRSSYKGPVTPGLGWEITGEGNGTAAVIGKNGVIYAGLGTKFMAVRSDGSVIWCYTASQHFNASPAIAANGRVFVPNDDGALYVFEPDGSLAWKYTTGGWIGSAPVLAADGTIYFGSSDARLRALTPRGALKWEFQAGSWINSSPAIGTDGTIYFGSTDRNVYALNSDGTLKWRYQTGGYIDSGPAIGPNGTVYVPVLDGYLYALSPTDGSLLWRFNTQGELSWVSPAIATDGTIYLPSADPTPQDGYSQARLYALRPDGTIKWQVQLANNPHTAPTIGADGTIYLTLNNGRLVAFNPDKTLRWQIVLDSGAGGLNFNPVISADGKVYISAYWPAHLYSIHNVTRTYLPVVQR